MCARWLTGLALTVLPVAPVRADCLLDIITNSVPPFATFDTVFPNWTSAPLASFYLDECPDGTCGIPSAPLAGITIMNYASATGGAGGDLTTLYFQIACGTGTNTALAAMTYAGLWTVPLGTFPAWTWSGSIAWGSDPCALPTAGCACGVALNLYGDINPCPTDGAVIKLGPGFNDTLNPGAPGGVYDASGCNVPAASPPTFDPKTIRYVLKRASPAVAAPGDTVTYTISYGRPGTGNINTAWVTDSLPAFVHYVGGSGVPPPDPGWDPDPGPPVRVRWTVPGPLATAGGPTGEVQFQVTVDWGNGESFEPGSGDVAAPEGAVLQNAAHFAWDGTGCAPGRTSPIPSFAVRRFLFWMVGDNDVLFASSYGQAPDPVTYSIFLKNMSATRTWWNVTVWDTVPAELDVWCAGCGHNDPCAGWTMTPGGCAAASPGRLAAGGKTLLTWRLDMPPGATLDLQWTAQLRPVATAGGTVINQVKVLELGRTGVAGGTGSSIVPANFTHLAPVVLQTMYISFTAFMDQAPKACPGLFIPVFPLNKRAQFSLYGIQYDGSSAFGAGGGVSDPIGCLVGDCLGGFPGNGACGLGMGAINGGGLAGCKVERTPAKYDPVPTTPCPNPANFVYKIVSNAPVDWQLLIHNTGFCAANDNMTDAPSTTLTYVGMTHYMWRRNDGCGTTPVDMGDSLCLINTGLDAYGAVDPNLRTNVHLFQFDYATLAWQYRRTYLLDGESAAYDMGTPPAEDGPWRTLSSDTQLIVPHFSSSDQNDWEYFFPTRETGNIASKPGLATFYGLCNANLAAIKAAIANIGITAATYDVYRYVPYDMAATPPMPANLNGTSGYWLVTAIGAMVAPSLPAPANLADVNNTRIYPTYGAAFDATSLALFKVVQRGGGGLTVMGGTSLFSQYAGGAVLHAANGDQVGSQFMWAVVGSGLTAGMDIFCPKAGQVVQMVGQNGYSAAYTTNGPDECVYFKNPGDGVKIMYKITDLTGGTCIALFNERLAAEKGYTAPFVLGGIHYNIIAPPVAFTGQSFWITVIVVNVGSQGNTKTDYCGTTSFTSTDPAAKIQATAMDGYNYTWSSNDPLAPCAGAGCAGTCDNGVRLFFNVTLTALGMQTIVGADTADGSITGLAAILVVGADVKLTKTPGLTVGASGDIVTFRVCWSNYSSASAFTFVITDAVPQGTAFVPEAGTTAFNCGNTDGVLPVVAYSTAASATPPAAFTTGNPVIGTYWLRWTIPQSGVQTTGCICYRVSVN